MPCTRDAADSGSVRFQQRERQDVATADYKDVFTSVLETFRARIGRWPLTLAMSSILHADRLIARKILRGDAREFRTLFDAYFPRLYRFALVRLDGDAEAASDVVQQTFCKAIERLDSYRGEAALYTWFCQICRNSLIDYCRARRREWATRTLEDEPDIRAILEAVAAPASSQPELQAWQRDIHRLVQATMDTLPERYGDILEWKYVDGLSVNDIAERLSVGVKAAESQLTRARAAFREAIMAMIDVPHALQPPGEDC